MGMTYIQGTVLGPQGEEPVTFLVDSGAKYSLLPERVWRKIGLREGRLQQFSLADGSTITRPVSECEVSLPQGSGPCVALRQQPVSLDQPRSAAEVRVE